MKRQWQTEELVKFFYGLFSDYANEINSSEADGTI